MESNAPNGHRFLIITSGRPAKLSVKCSRFRLSFEEPYEKLCFGRCEFDASFDMKSSHDKAFLSLNCTFGWRFFFQDSLFPRQFYFNGFFRFAIYAAVRSMLGLNFRMAIYLSPISHSQLPDVFCPDKVGRCAEIFPSEGRSCSLASIDLPFSLPHLRIRRDSVLLPLLHAILSAVFPHLCAFYFSSFTNRGLVRALAAIGWGYWKCTVHELGKMADRGAMAGRTGQRTVQGSVGDSGIGCGFAGGGSMDQFIEIPSIDDFKCRTMLGF
jgi:hypothetical protein